LPLVFSSTSYAKTLHGTLIRVCDGDTILVRVQGRKEYVRLREIDAPEISRRKQAGQEPWGKKARLFALSLVKDRAIRLEVEERDERDTYRRLLAYVFAGEVLINRELIQSGNAFFSPGRFHGRHASQLERAEGAAREKGVGVWDRKNGLRESPRDFRIRTQREESLFSRFGSSESKKRHPAKD